MPTYEYKREDGTTFEISQRMSENSLTICPTTGQTVKRVISGGSGVVYKGEGWYVTDYKNGGNKDASIPPETTTKTSEKTADSSPESSTNK